MARMAAAEQIALPPPPDAAPARVVSMNLCTDLLAMLLAGEGQLWSVSRIALDPMVSPLADEARDHVINHSRAEEIYLMRPDLVLASTLSPRSTVLMLERLGIEVAQFAPASTLEDVRDRVIDMGRVLGREAAARAVLARFDARLAALGTDQGPRPRAVIYHANGYVSGRGSLSGDILERAGFANAAHAAGYGSGQVMPLEVLALSDPDIVVTARTYPGGSRSEEVLSHPVVRAFRAGRESAVISDQSWVCGTPFVLDAVEQLAEARRRIMAGAGE
ncbi:ABC transporter substrate-binding protein [Aquicoccus porphyridii]|uniref:ABC transporter substrate-binding protein n=1 Tax=Aquicoccus porphyridii TaxID=1852029 RepID=A0A5A9ZGI5_9RHOB|nr:ABC transporter substrate-binding protein [Aquicoccus porphyridii]KAA0916378.1 ABC transporter substrate-binding protein [Aquicoccus porphyridii]RAI53498.1 ABC transporter substrate-binding protein [Rhodobacteraceae bacterium AsT-22]